MKSALKNKIWISGTAFAIGCLGVLIAVVQADQVELENGDRYTGKVLSINETNITVQSEITGVMHLPRSKVAVITLGERGRTGKSTNPVPAVAPSSKAENKDTAANPLKDGLDAKTVKQVQEQMLANAGPEAASQFNNMVAGLLTGSLSVEDIRAKALASVKDLQDAKQDLGEDFGSVLDGYLTILQGFLNEAEAASTAKPAPKASAEEQE